MSDKYILRSNVKPIENRFKTVGEYMWNKLLALDENTTCLIDARTDQRITYGEFRRQAISIAVALIGRGMRKTDRIAFSGQNSIQHSVLRFVSFFLGITLMPLSPTFEKYEVEQEVKSAGATIVCTSLQDLYKFDDILDDSHNNNETNVKLVVVFDGKHDKYLTFEQLLEEGRDRSLHRIPHFDVDPEKDTFFLIHTSGSTGRPKCAMMPHRTLLNSCMDIDSYYQDDNADRSVIAMVYPFGHLSGTTMLPLLLVRGPLIVLFGEFDEEFLYKSIERYKITLLPAFPHIGRRLIEGELVDRYDMSSLKVMSTGGAAFPGHIAKAIIDKYGIVFREGYGMTEAMFVTKGPGQGEEFMSGNTGRLAPGVELKILDLKTGQSVGANIDGEICIRSNKLFTGYLNDGKATEEAIDKDGWYRTGDIGHYDEKERLFITDRLKEVVRIGVDNHYINISPVEIELFLLKHKSIAEVAVVGVNNRTGTHWPRAYVVLKEGQNATENEIQHYVSDTLAYTKQLKGGVVFVDSIPRTSIGKVDRKYFRKLVSNEIID